MIKYEDIITDTTSEEYIALTNKVNAVCTGSDDKIETELSNVLNDVEAALWILAEMNDSHKTKHGVRLKIPTEGLVYAKSVFELITASDIHLEYTHHLVATYVPKMIKSTTDVELDVINKAIANGVSCITIPKQTEELYRKIGKLKMNKNIIRMTRFALPLLLTIACDESSAEQYVAALQLLTMLHNYSIHFSLIVTKESSYLGWTDQDDDVIDYKHSITEDDSKCIQEAIQKGKYPEQLISVSTGFTYPIYRGELITKSVQI